MTNDGGVYTYDAASRMKTAGGTNYGFDGDGRRVRVQQGGYSSIYYLWSSVLNQPVAEIVGDTGSLFQAYVYGPNGQMVALLSNDGGFYWNHTDHLGSGRKLTDSTGAVRYRGEFDPHGQVVLETGGATYLNSKKYTGYEREWSTNLDYAKARMYSHNRARFMQPDLLGLAAADLTAPQTLNSYSYVANDPVNFVDPTGTDIIAITSCVTITAEGAIIGIDCETKYYVTSGGLFRIGGGSGGIGEAGGGGGGPQGGGGSGSGDRGSGAGTQTQLNLKGFIPCTLDAALNAGISLIPGGPAFLIVAGYLGVNLNVFQYAAGEKNLVTGPGTIQDFSKIGSGVARDITTTAYGVNGDVALKRAADLVSRPSYAGKSASSQAKLLGSMKSLSRLGMLAKAIPIISTAVTLGAFALDVKDCYEKYNH